MNSLRLHLAAIINQHPNVIHTDLSRDFKKLATKRILFANILAFLMQYIGLMLSTLHHVFTPLWLASGTACAFVFLRGCSILPGIWLGTLLAYYAANSGILYAVTYATLLTLQAYALLRLCYRYVSPTLLFYQRSQYLTFLGASLLVTALVSLGLAIVFYAHVRTNIPLHTLWLQWWLANFNGLCIFGCAIVAWDAFFPQVYLLKQHLSQVIRLYGLLIASSIILLCVQDLTSVIVAMIFLFTLTFMVSKKYQWCGLITALFMQGFLINMASFIHDGIFVSHSSYALLLQALLCSEALLGLLAI